MNEYQLGSPWFGRAGKLSGRPAVTPCALLTWPRAKDGDETEPFGVFKDEQLEGSTFPSKIRRWPSRKSSSASLPENTSQVILITVSILKTARL